MENLFTITGFAAAVHRDRATITRALRGIKPTQQRDGRSHYALHVIFDAMLKYQQRGGTSRKPDGKPSEQELLTKARREKIEQENRERRGRLVDFKVVEHVMKARDSLIREKALTLPGQLQSEIDVPGVEPKVRARVYEMLNELADPNSYDWKRLLADVQSDEDLRSGDPDAAVSEL